MANICHLTPADVDDLTLIDFYLLCKQIDRYIEASKP